MGHARLSPSGALRWGRCPGSVALEAGYPDHTSSFAQYGSDMHHLSAHCLENDAAPADFIGAELTYIDHGEERTFTVDEEMGRAAQRYVDFCREIALGADVVFVEAPVPLGHITGEEGAKGTADFVAVTSNADDTVTLSVVDLKGGKGVRVSAYENPQLILYALGTVEELDYLLDGATVEVDVFIHQPRLDTVSEFHLTLDELREWGEHFAQAAAATRDPNAPRVPGEAQCRFCKARHDCPDLRRHVLEATESDIELVEDLGEVLPKLKMIRDWCASVEARAMERLQAGDEIPGWKLVEGRSMRAWGDQDAVMKAAKGAKLKVDEYAPRSLLSVAQLEKHLGKSQFFERFATLVIKKPGKPALAPASDPRPSVHSADALGFENLEQEDAA